MTRRSPVVTSVVTGLLLVVAGFVAIALGKRVVAATPFVVTQVSGIVSGALGGLALIAVGCVVAQVQIGRWIEDQARLDNDRAIDLLAELAVVESTPPQRPARRRRAS